MKQTINVFPELAGVDLRKVVEDPPIREVVYVLSAADVEGMNGRFVPKMPIPATIIKRHDDGTVDLALLLLVPYIFSHRSLSDEPKPGFYHLFVDQR